MSAESPFARKPPQDINAEISVLGAILIDNKLFEVVSDMLVPDDFYRESHKTIFGMMVCLVEAKRPIDAITLCEALGAKLLEQIGGPQYIADLAIAVPDPSNVEHYARIVKDRALLRHLGSWAVELASRTYEAPGHWSPQWTRELLDVAEYEIGQMASGTHQKPRRPVSEILDTMAWRLEHGESLGIKTGFEGLDNKIGGLTPGDLHVIGARANVGKTRLAAAISLNLLAQQLPVFFVSLEMPEPAMWQRFAGAKAEVDTFQVARSAFTETGRQRFAQAIQELKQAPLRILYHPGLKPRELRIEAKRAQRELKSLGLIVVDYLGLMRPDRVTRERFADRGDIVQSLKELAGEMECPILAVSQLNREVEEKKAPNLSQLRDTGMTEEHASTVLLVWAPPVNKTELRLDPEGGTEIEIIIAKARNGPSGRCRMFFRESTGKFLDV